MRKKIELGIAIVIVLIVVALFAEYWFRCHGKPLSREEGLHRAQVRLESLSKSWILGDPLPTLTGEQFDAKDGSWTFTFRNDTCEVDIITDRCKGTDVGGMSEGCTHPRPAPVKQ
jgi:hypothetical protein